jgi:hypothetical protein
MGSAKKAEIGVRVDLDVRWRDRGEYLPPSPLIRGTTCLCMQEVGRREREMEGAFLGGRERE